MASLETSRLRLTMDDSSGCIVSLKSRATGHEYLRSGGAAWSLALEYEGRVSGLLCDPWGYEVTAAEQHNAEVREGRSEAGLRGIEVTHQEVTGTDGTLRVSVGYSVYERPDGAVDLRYTVRNDSTYVVEDVLVPILGGLVPRGEVARAELVYPCQRWRLKELLPIVEGSAWEQRPYHAAVLGSPPRWPSMYELAMPWVDVSGEGEGLCLASTAQSGLRHQLLVRDRQGLPVEEITPEAGVLDVGWGFFPHLGPGTSWQSPTLVLALHAGDWHVAADLYRDTLQGWYENVSPASSRFWSSVASFNTCLTARDFGQINRVAADVSRYGVNDLVTWYFGDYYPMLADRDTLDGKVPRLGQLTDQFGGEGALLHSVNTAARSGVAVGTIVSQRLWNVDTLPDTLRRQAEDLVMRTMAGHAVREDWNHRHYGAVQWGSHISAELYVMCTACATWQEMAIENVAALLKRSGYATLFYDQSTEQNLCFAKEHDHDDPSAPQVASADFLRRLRDLVHDTHDHGALIGEGVELLTSQFTDMNWCWVYRGWRHATERHTRYRNPEVARYTLPWVRIAFSASMDRASLNEMFVLGLHLALIPESLETGKVLSDFPEVAAHVQALAKLWGQVTQRLGTLGDARYLDDLGLAIHGCFARCYTRDGSLCVLVANVEPTRRPFDVLLRRDRYTVPVGQCEMITTSHGEEMRYVDQPVTGHPDGAVISGELDGYEVRCYLLTANLH